MKAIFKKELRENVALAVPGLLILSLMLLQTAHNHSALMRRMGYQYAYWPMENMQPLLDSGFLSQTAFFCGIFGAVLGWLQIFRERHRDLRAFLLHRPATRNSIFLGKIAAGALLYLLTTALPLICFVAWVAAPARVAAPFEWRMALPVLSHLLAGMVLYFGGMLTGLRQARWYGSRGIGLAAAIVAAFLCVIAGEFWEALLAVLVIGALLAICAWGAFLSNGHYVGQPAPAKAALTFSAWVGFAALLAAAAGFLTALFSTNDFEWSYYAVSKQGVIYKIVQRSGRPGQIVDLEGKTLMDPKTHRAMEVNEFNQKLASMGASVNVDFKKTRPGGYRNAGRYFLAWPSPHETAWYLWRKYGRLVGYDKDSRQIVGSLGPDGFSKRVGMAGKRFEEPGNYYQGNNTMALHTRTMAYDLDFENRSVRPIMDAGLDEPIGGATKVMNRSSDWVYTLVATRRGIHLVKHDGTTLWRIPYQPSYPNYATLTLSLLEADAEFVLQFHPLRNGAAGEASTNMPVHFKWIGADHQVSKTLELPQAPFPQNFADKWLGLVAPPGVLMVALAVDKDFRRIAGDWRLFQFSLAAVAIGCMAIGWSLGRRYNFSLRSRVGWAVFHLLTGLPGLLAYIAIQEWPARVRCPNCSKLRIVTRETCVHCGSAFPPPEKVGIEIFEPLPPLKPIVGA
jgi:ABC-type transport system involved in multi-copper enzyme maturation permease subunit